MWTLQRNRVSLLPPPLPLSLFSVPSTSPSILLSTPLFISPSISLDVLLFVSLFTSQSIFPSTSLSISLSLDSLHVSIHLSLYPSIFLPACSFLIFRISIFYHPSIQLSIYFSIYFSIFNSLLTSLFHPSPSPCIRFVKMQQ